MKKHIIGIGLFFLMLGACSESEITTYNSPNYIQFSKEYVDSMTVSFQFFPGVETVDVPLRMEMSGLFSGEEMEYKVVTDTEHSTAIEGTHFSLPEKLVFRSDRVADTCWITLKKTPEMTTKEFRIVLKVADNRNFFSGPPAYSTAIIRVNDKISQPEWWSGQIIWYYLGEYSDLKFMRFIEVTGVADMSMMNASERRTYALKFKYWLEEQKKAGNTILEEDNTEMTVPVIG